VRDPALIVDPAFRALVCPALIGSSFIVAHSSPQHLRMK
jgi:hypothetical protein